MVRKSNHRHIWVRCLQQRDPAVWPYTHRLVMKCTVCNRVKDAPYPDVLVRVKHEYKFLLTKDELVSYYGELPELGPGPRLND